MMKIVNEELRIQSCGIEDLSEEKKELFVKQFNGDSISTLTLFYDSDYDLVVLNHDNMDYDLYELVAVSYLEADSKKKKYIKEKSNDLLSETFQVLDGVIEYRKRLEIDQKAKKLKKILGQQPMENYIEVLDMLEALKRIDERWQEPGWRSLFEYNTYMYGYIQGIRAERNRRKKVQA